MNSKNVQIEETRLREVLREARPEPVLPPRFQESVWRRIERTDRNSAAVEPLFWSDRLTAWMLRPRLAIAGAITMVLLGGIMGALDGTADAREIARDRYVASVAPQLVR